MQEIMVLGSKDYDVTGKNYGDCFIINTGTGLYLYDCGSVEHTHRALSIDEFRAFAMVDEWAPLIFINSADTESAKLFSLVHEVAHI